MTGDDELHRRVSPQSPEPAADTSNLAADGGRSTASGFGAHGGLLAAGGLALLAVASMMLGLLPSPFGTFEGSGARSQLVAPVGTSLFTPVATSELDSAIALLMMPDADKSSIRAQLKRGQLRIALITVSDNDAEDGDWVSIGAAGFRQDVRLFHKPYVVAVPYLPGVPVVVTGLKDGGGGDITVAVTVGAAKLQLKPLKERETVELLPP